MFLCFYVSESHKNITSNGVAINIETISNCIAKNFLYLCEKNTFDVIRLKTIGRKDAST